MRISDERDGLKKNLFKMVPYQIQLHNYHFSKERHKRRFQYQWRIFTKIFGGAKIMYSNFVYLILL